jgi:hypothetical protein
MDSEIWVIAFAFALALASIAKASPFATFSCSILAASDDLIKAIF